MEPDRWRRIDELFHAALALPPGQREAFLARQCGEDAGLKDEVTSLVAHARDADAFLESLTDVPTRVSPLPDRVAHYRVVGLLGEGGMGRVFVAEDERLHRRVALKLLRPDSTEPNAGLRLAREARIVAAISHPLICQVYELGDWNGQPFIAMELVDGESLTARLERGRLTPREALRLGVLLTEALAVLHARGIVHRDLKPSNVFVTGESLKLLDFGLARSFGDDGARQQTVTHDGVIVGTPRYAAPEQLSGAPVDARADLFSVGALLFEMLSGTPAFSGVTVPAVIHAVLYETPAVLTGSPAVAAIDRVLHRALAKRPEDRHQSADALAGDLRAVLPLVGDDPAAGVRRMSRLAVLPFRTVRPDPEIAYLAVSFAEALIDVLSGRESVIVRPLLKSARYAAPLPDLNALATDLAVDAVLSGSIERQHGRLCVRAELLSAPGGDRWWSETAEIEEAGLHELRNRLATRVLTSLSGDENASDVRRVGSRDPRAFELYLRGMQLRMEPASWRQARAYFERSLEADPEFAAAWAERGRLDRVLAKYGDRDAAPRAEAALSRALAIDPNNAAAEHYFALLEIDTGRVDAALTRLLPRVAQRRAEPQMHAALVQAYRYAGFLDESVRAHETARHLDPTITTSVLHTFYHQANYARALDEGFRTSDPFEARVLGAMKRWDEAIAAARREEDRFAAVPILRVFSSGLRAALEGKRSEALTAVDEFTGSGFSDGEGLFYIAELAAFVDDHDRAFDVLDASIAAGFACPAGFANSPYLDALREDSRWLPLMTRVESRRRPAVAARGETLP